MPLFDRIEEERRSPKAGGLLFDRLRADTTPDEEATYWRTRAAEVRAEGERRRERDAIDRSERVARTMDAITEGVAGAFGAGALVRDVNRLRDRGRTGRMAADAAKDEGFLDRAGSLLESAAADTAAGAERAASGFLPESPLRRLITARAAQLERGAQSEIAGEQKFADIDSAGDVGQFVVEQGLRSAPGMAMAALGPAGAVAYGTSLAGQIGQTRAENNGELDASLGDVAVGALAAAPSAVLERFGIGRIVKPGASTAVGRAGKAAFTEAATEAAQSSIEYAGGTLGTEAGFDSREMGRQALAGAVAGAGIGGGIRGGIEIVDGSARLVRGDGARRPTARGIREAVEAEAATPSEEDIASPLPTELIAAGRAEIARGEATPAVDALLRDMGVPSVGSRVDVVMPNGERLTGAVTDAFEADAGEAGGGRGVKIRLEDGTVFEEFADTLVEAGVRIELADRAEEPAPVEEAEPIEPAEVVEQPAPRPVETTGALIDRVMPLIGRAESPSDTARNPRSSAQGRYQFIDSTWLRTYRDEFGATGESDAQILARKTDGALQDRLMRRLTAGNIAQLERAGVGVDAGTVYLAHFAGPGGAIALARADPNAPVEQVLGAGVVRANPFLRGKDAGDVIAWASSKMGAAPREGGRTTTSIAQEAEPIQWQDIAFAEPEQMALADTEARPEPVAREEIEAPRAAAVLAEGEPTAAVEQVAQAEPSQALAATEAAAPEAEPAVPERAPQQVSTLRQLIEARAAPANRTPAESLALSFDYDRRVGREPSPRWGVVDQSSGELLTWSVDRRAASRTMERLAGQDAAGVRLGVGEARSLAMTRLDAPAPPTTVDTPPIDATPAQIAPIASGVSIAPAALPEPGSAEPVAAAALPNVEAQAPEVAQEVDAPDMPLESAPETATEPVPAPRAAPSPTAVAVYDEDTDAQIAWFEPESGAITRLDAAPQIASETPGPGGPVAEGVPEPATIAAASGAARQLPLFRIIDPVTSVRGDQIADVVDGDALKMRILRTRAYEFYQRELQDSEATGSDGVRVLFSKVGGRKSTAGKGEELLRALPAVRSIIERGEVKALPDRRAGMRAFLYAAPIELDGETVRMGVVVREDANGRRYYALVRDNGGAEARTADAGALNLFRVTDDLDLADLDAWADEAAEPSDLAAVQADLERRLAQLGIADRVRVAVVDKLFGDARIAGQYHQRLIQVALDSGQDARATLDHEAIHALRDLGLFRPAEWSVLAAAARADAATMASVRRRYPDLDQDAQIEEAIADRFAAWAAGRRERGVARRVFERIRALLAALGQALRGGGFATADGVMRVVEGGTVGTRADAARADARIRRSVTGDEPVAPKRRARNFREARAAVGEFQGQSLLNQATGLAAVVSRSSLDKMLSAKAVAKSITPEEHALAVANLDQLYPVATQYEIKPDERASAHIAAIRRFEAIMAAEDGRSLRVMMLVKETTNPLQSNPLYTVEVRSVERVEPASVPSSLSAQASALQQSRNVAPADSDTNMGAAEPKGKQSRVGALPGALGRSSAESEPVRSPASIGAFLDSLRPEGPVRERMNSVLRFWRIGWQDKMLPQLQLQRAIEQRIGRRLGENENPYIAEELMSGKIGARLERLSKETVEPLFAAMQRDGITIGELESYLYARHAPERNARIAAINPEFGPGGGSGMSDAEAAEIMAAAEAEGKTPALQRLAKQVDAMLAGAMQARVDAGLMSADEARSWQQQYQFYVPLRGQREVFGEQEEPARVNRASGITVRGKESKRAFGRKSKANDILGYAILAAEEAITRAELNAVAQEFVALARANPDPSFWRIDKVSRRAVWNKATDQVEYRSESRLLAEDAPFTVTAKIDGEEVRVTLDRQNPAAVEIADAMRNLTAVKFQWVVQHIGKFTRAFSQINTRFSPPFVVSNAIRDLMTASVMLQQYDTPGLTKAVLRDWRHALTATADGKGEWSRLRREWERAGGKVYFNQQGDLALIKREMEARIRRAQSGAGLATAWRKFFEGVDLINDSVERAVRLSVYKNLRELGGMSERDAASASRNITVNFTRRGKYSTATNAFYAFFNAATQGSANLILAGLKHRKVRQAMMGFVVAGFAADMLNSMIAGEDEDGESFWDKVPEHERSRNAILMLPDGNGGDLKLPLSYGLNALYALGANTSAVMRGAKTPLQGAWDSAMTTLEAFNPLGGGGAGLTNTLAPTIADPYFELRENRDFTGRPIQPEANPFEPAATPSSNYFSGVPTWAKAVTSALNSVTGGDAVRPGVVSVSPEALEYLLGYFTGGAGRFVMSVGDLATVPLDPEREFSMTLDPQDAGREVTPNELPILRSLVGAKAPWYDRSSFYTRIGQVEQQVEYGKEYEKREDASGLDALIREEAALLSLEPDVKAARKVLREVRKERSALDLAHELDRIDEAAWRSQRDELDAIEEATAARFNARWNVVMRPPK